jgi:membrane protein
MSTQQPPGAGIPDSPAVARARAVLARLPGPVRGLLEHPVSRWTGRTCLHTAASCIRVEIFDRSMTIAAQVFTSVLPILILAATWLDGDDSEGLSELVGIPDESREIVDQLVDGADTAAFGVVGTLLVLISATSLSRALSRAAAVAWEVRRPRQKLSSAWRWLAVVLALALAVVVAQSLTQRVGTLPPRAAWPVVLSAAIDGFTALFVPWVLLAGAVPARRLLPGAAAFALLMMPTRLAAQEWLPHALQTSADRYGAIGLAFAYLAWLYVVAFIFIGTLVLGRTVATDTGRVGALIRGSGVRRR